MKRFLSPSLHGMVDYLLVAALIALPLLTGVKDMEMAVCYCVAGVLLAMSLVTAYPLSMAKKLSFAYHGVIEFYVSIGMAVFGLATLRSGGWIVLALGAVLFGIFSATDFSEAASTLPRRANKAA